MAVEPAKRVRQMALHGLHREFEPNGNIGKAETFPGIEHQYLPLDRPQLRERSLHPASGVGIG